jgi:ribonuclease P protein component
MPTKRLTLRRAQRLAHDRQYRAVYAARAQKNRGPIAVSAAPNGLAYCRLGLSIGRRVGGAVARNRAKRLIREAFRLGQHDLPQGDGAGLDLVVSIRSPAALDLETCRAALADITAALAREWARRRERPDVR